MRPHFKITLAISILMIFSPLMTIFPQGVEAVELTNEILLSDNNEEQTLKQFDSLSSNYFIQNDGQMIGSESLFYSTSGDIHFLPDAVLMRFRELEPVFEDEKEKRELMDPFEEDTPDSFYEKGVVLKYSFVDANKMVPYGREKCSWNTNYFKGSDPDHWYTDIPNYNEIVFPEVWDGIDIVYRLKDGNVKYDIVLSPEADPGLIQFRIEGNTDIVIDESGDLVIGTEYRDILDSGLIAFYGDSEDEGIDVDFKLIKRDYFGFEMGSYDRSRGVVIDPLIYSTFIGGNAGDYGFNIDVDSSGNAYVTGQTYVSTTDYPTTTGAYDKSFNGGSDVFVTKLNSAGSSLVYSTFLGGSKTDEGRSITIDSSGNAYLTGFTYDSTTDYPTTTLAYDRIHNGYTDVFVTKLNATGSSLIYSTFIGGSNSDSGYGIAVDSSGNAYVTGRTIDTDDDFPTTSGTYDSTFNGGYDVFITKVNSVGSSLIYSTFIGGSGLDTGFDIAIDASGNAYVAGYSNSSTTDYPTTTGAYDRTHNGDYDAFVTKLNSAGSSLVYSTFIGGSGDDKAFGIAIDPSGNAYVTGYTQDSTKDHPTTAGAYDRTHNGNFDVFVTKLNSAGSSLVYSTFIGGSDKDIGYGIAIGHNGNAYVAGITQDSTTNYPTTTWAYDRIQNGYTDVFVTKLNSAGSSLAYSTYIGGSGVDHVYDLAIDPRDNCYVTGRTDDSTTDYPTTTGTYDTSHNGNYDVFVTRLLIDTIAPIFGNDGSDTSGTTGDIFHFSINATDNVDVIGVHVEYWFDSGSHRNTSMSGTGPYLFSRPAPSKAKMIHYIFHAYDFARNWNQTMRKNVSIEDNDRPLFGTDSSDTAGTTGETFNFSIEVTDNFDVTGVYVEYWFGAGPNNSTMSGTGPYNQSVILPSNATVIHYMIHANDSSGNWATASQVDVTINDNDRPVFGADGSDTAGTTGETFNFSIEVTDNLAVTGVYIEYWFGTGPNNNSTMLGTYPNNYSITIPSNATVIHYVFHAHDSAYNWATASQVDMTITDINKPTFGADNTPNTGTTGETFNFSIAVTDNIAVQTISVEYWFGTGTHTNTTMDENETYTLTILIPSNSIDDLHYIFHASDEVNNWAQTQIRNITIIDTEKPISIAGQNLTIENGDMVLFDGSGSTDNLMIENYTWSFDYDDEVVYLYGALHSFYFIIPDIYYVNLSVRDTFGNEDYHIMTLNVLDTHDPVAIINGSRSALPGENIVLDGSRSTDNGKIVRYLWTFEDDGLVMIEGPLLSYLINRTGVMIITLSVWDDSGRLNQTETTITFFDTNNPTAVAPGDASIPVGRTFNFVGIYSTDDGVIVKYQWDLVYDLVETTLFGATVNFTFDIPGTYPITLTVYDQTGNTGETTFIITVVDTGNFEGAVFADEERRIPGATVILTDTNGKEYTAETDSEGKFVFTNIPMGTAHYKVIKSGYEIFEDEITIEPGITLYADSSAIVLVEEENEEDASPNYYVIFGLILLVLIIISGVIFMFIRFAKGIPKEMPPPEEDTSITSEEAVEEEIPTPPTEGDTIPDEPFVEPQQDPLTTLQEDPFDNYDLPQDQTEQMVEPPTEIETGPIEDIPQEDNTEPLPEPLQDPDQVPDPVS